MENIDNYPEWDIGETRAVWFDCTIVAALCSGATLRQRPDAVIGMVIVPPGEEKWIPVTKIQPGIYVLDQRLYPFTILNLSPGMTTHKEPDTKLWWQMLPPPEKPTT